MRPVCGAWPAPPFNSLTVGEGLEGVSAACFRPGPSSSFNSLTVGEGLEGVFLRARKIRVCELSIPLLWERGLKGASNAVVVFSVRTTFNSLTVGEGLEGFAGAWL